MPADCDDILRKIRACLALGESQEPHEAAAALRQAEALMRRHDLDRAAVEQSVVEEAEAAAGRSAHLAVYLRVLAHVVATAMSCRHYLSRPRTVAFVGVGNGPVAFVGVVRVPDAVELPGHGCVVGRGLVVNGFLGVHRLFLGLFFHVLKGFDFRHSPAEVFPRVFGIYQHPAGQALQRFLDPLGERAAEQRPAALPHPVRVHGPVGFAHQFCELESALHADTINGGSTAGVASGVSSAPSPSREPRTPCHESTLSTVSATLAASMAVTLAVV
jgi:hypothetical protein